MLLLLASLAHADDARMRVHFIDVGQGAATLVELPCGAMLVDTGGEESEAGTFHSTEALTTYLKAFFARRTDLKNTLDLLLLTHPHIDHLRGAVEVLNDFTIKRVVDSGQTPVLDINKQARDAYLGWLTGHPQTAHQSISLADFPADHSAYATPNLDPFPACKGVDPRVRALWGQVPSDPGWGEDDHHHKPFENENNHSVVTRVDFGAASLLIMGDLEAVAQKDLVGERKPADLDADILVVGHHGSYNGTTRELLEAVTPKYAVIEMGPSSRHEPWTAWQYGHPRQPAFDLLEEFVSGTRTPVTEPVATAVRQFGDRVVDKAIYATGWEGTVVLEEDEKGAITVGKPDAAPPLRR